jgi:PAS domain S-box-containing protein
LTILWIGNHADDLASLAGEPFQQGAALLAEDGPSGMELARRENPDLILLNLTTPGVDGVEICRSIQADSATQDIPIVFLTESKADRPSRLRALEAGAEAFLRTPVDEAEFTALVRAMRKVKAANIQRRQERETPAAASGKPAFLHGETPPLGEENYRRLFEAASVGIGYYSPDGKIISFNASAAKHLGGQPADFCGKTIDSVFPRPAADEYMERIRKTALTGKAEEFEDKVDLPGGTRWFVSTIAPILSTANRVIGVQTISTDITRIKRTEMLLREGELALNRAQHVSHFGSWIWRIALNRLEWSDEMYRIFGIRKENFTGNLAEVVASAIHPDDRAAVDSSNNSVAQDGKPIPLEYRVVWPDGTVRTVWAEAGELFLDKEGNPEVLTGIVQDITERKQMENQRQLENELLHICHFASDTPQLIHALADFFQRVMDCEAVGVRLHQGEDFPYYETRGLPDDFIATERLLCARDQHGELLRTTSGAPILECMCGNILCGRFDPSKPYFTRQGSFWTNSTSELLASTTEKERLGRTRNRCNGEGYESVALVPVRAQGKTLGLFQFNDRRKGLYTAERIEFMENLVNYVALALANLQAAEALRESEKRYRLLFDSMESGFALHEIICDAQGAPCDYRFLEINPAFGKVTGLKSEALIGHTVLEIMPGTEREWIEKYGRVALRGESIQFEQYSHELAKYFHVSAYSPTRGQFAVIFQDITERKRAEEEMLKNKIMLTNILNSVPQTIFWKDCEGKFLGCNEKFARTVGLSDPQQVVGKPDAEIAAPGADIASYRTDDADVIARRQPKRHIDEQVLAANGTTIWTDTTKVPLMDSNGDVYGVLGVFEDITDRKLAERQISDQLTELRRWYSAMLGREKRIMDLKAEVNELLLERGQPQRYAS